MNTHRSHWRIGLVSLLVSLSLNMAWGQAVTVTSPVILQSEETSDLIEKGMTQDMVLALIGRPTKTDMEQYYQDGLSVQAVALGISMNLL